MSDSLAPSPSRADLFLTYGKIGLIGFGGINAWARRVLVEEKRWLTEQDYAETLGLGQVLPGPNALNAAIMVGDRFHGAVGALLASCSMFGGPLIILMGLAVLYDSYGEVPMVKAVPRFTPWPPPATRRALFLVMRRPWRAGHRAFAAVFLSTSVRTT